MLRRDDVRALEDRDEDAPQRAVAFRAGYVFCRSQVEPMPGRTPAPLALPEPSIDGAEHRRALERLEASLSADGWRLDRAELPRGVEGRCDSERHEITLSRGLGIDAQLRVLVHEASHAEGVRARSHGRERAECIVEAARVFDAFTDVRHHHLTRDDQPVQTFEPQLTPLQRQLLQLLGVPDNAYHSTPSRP